MNTDDDPGPCLCWGGPAIVHAGHCCLDDDAHQPDDAHIVAGRAIYAAYLEATEA